jgi:galactonate dehydratase
MRPALRIEDVRWFIVGPGGNQVLVEISLDNGVTGWGEASLSSREHAVAGALQDVRSVCIGASAWQRGALWQELHRRQYHEGLAIVSHACAGIDIALHDAVAKSLEVPVYELLGGRHRDRIELFATVVSRGAGDSDALGRVTALVDEGWRVIRVMHVPDTEAESRFDPWGSVRALQSVLPEIRERAPEAVIGLECHHRFTVPEAASLVAGLPPGTIDFIEEPIRAHSPAAYRRFRDQSRLPIAFGEELTDKWQFMPYFNDGLVDFARIDVCHVGGLTEAVKIAAVAECHYVDVMPHNPLGPVATTASAQLALSIPNFATLEYRESPGEDLGFYRVPGVTVLPARSGPFLDVPDAPGLGVNVDADELVEVDSDFQFPRLTRPDGAYTNW